MAKLNFQQSASQDPPEIILICWFGAQEIFIIIIIMMMMKTPVLLNIVMENKFHFILPWIQLLQDNKIY